MKYCKDLQKGDLIGVAYNNYIYLAIYKCIGSRNNANFWFINQILMYKNTNRDKISTCYINRTDKPHGSPIVKINPDDLVNQQDYYDYIEATNYLKQKGYL